ncbi:hypothetical protein [Armatimonas rosea]|uniref:Uncharacterized protein n=1 Tax=Armatimonas rosea TaxID=685828 RepID=A0A7W9W9C8_ARMRO|nr:hypothetical protein [Armatimonas rosea]MBB6052487.1 hypothetical protein [Armatimonas rosea]
MRPILPLLAAVLASAAALAGPGLLTTIRRQVEGIDRRARRLPSTKLSLDGLSLEGGEARVWRDKQATKADVNLYGETGRRELLVYWTDRKPLFTYERTTRYPSPLGTPRPRGATDRTTQTRLYYDQGRLRSCRVGDKPRPLSDDTCQQTARLTDLLTRRVQ